jgi:hypothetical protein
MWRRMATEDEAERALVRPGLLVTLAVAAIALALATAPPRCHAIGCR